MAEQAKQGTEKPSLAEQYEFGEDQNSPQSGELASPPPAQTPAAAAPEPPTRLMESALEETPEPAQPPRPRNPDGTWRKADDPAGEVVPQFSTQEKISGHPPKLVQSALDYGLPDETIQTLSTAQLADAVRSIESRVNLQRIEGLHEQINQEAVQRGQQNIQQRPVEQAGPSPALSSSGVASATPDEFDLGVDLAKEGFDPIATKVFNTLRDHIKRIDQRNKELAATVDQLRAAENVRQTETIGDRLDRVFARYQQHFGPGKGREMDANDPNFQRRMAVLAIMDRDTSKATLEAKQERAIKLVYGGGTKPAAKPTPAADPLEERTRQWQAAALTPPTHRNGSPEPVGAAKAEQSVRERLHELSGQEENGQAGDDDFI